MGSAKGGDYYYSMPVTIGGAAQAGIYYGTWHNIPHGPHTRMGNGSHCLEHCKKFTTQSEAFEHFQRFFPGCDSQAKRSTMNINSPWEATNTTVPSKHLHNFYPGGMKGKNVYDCMAAATPEIAEKRNEASHRLGELQR